MDGQVTGGAGGPGRERTGAGGSLDLLRFGAALGVALTTLAALLPDATPLARFGWLAQDVLLLVSGFALGRIYGPGLDGRSREGIGVAVRGLVRLWPAQALLLLAFGVLAMVARLPGLDPLSPGTLSGAELARSALMMQGWAATRGGWNEPAWMLSVLVAGYALFPPVWAASRHLPRQALPILALTLLAVSMTAGRSLYGQDGLMLDVGVRMVRGLPLALAGMVLARWSASFAPSGAVRVAFGGPALGLLVVLTSARAEPMVQAGLMVAASILMLCIDGTRVPRPIYPMVRAGGRMAFGLMVTHALAGLVWIGLARILRIEGAGVLVAGLAFAIMVGWAFDRWLDRPAQAWLRARVAARPAAEPYAGWRTVA